MPPRLRAINARKKTNLTNSVMAADKRNSDVATCQTGLTIPGVRVGEGCKGTGPLPRFFSPPYTSVFIPPHESLN